MTYSAVIVDTNVVVAGVLTENHASPVARILSGMLAAAFSYVISEALLVEYRAVLLRPKLRKLHGLAVAGVDTILLDLVQHAIVLNPPPLTAPPAPDPADQFLWDLLAVRPDLLLITGDKILLQDTGMQGRVILPRVWIDGVHLTRNPR